MIFISTFFVVFLFRTPVVDDVSAAPSYLKATSNLAHTAVASAAVDPPVAAGAHDSVPSDTPVKLALISPSFAAGR